MSKKAVNDRQRDKKDMRHRYETYPKMKTKIADINPTISKIRFNVMN